jgi:hypothetical protein
MNDEDDERRHCFVTETKRVIRPAEKIRELPGSLDDG